MCVCVCTCQFAVSQGGTPAEQRCYAALAKARATEAAKEATKATKDATTLSAKLTAAMSVVAPVVQKASFQIMSPLVSDQIVEDKACIEKVMLQCSEVVASGGSRGGLSPRLPPPYSPKTA